MANENRLIDAMQTVTKISGRVTPLIQMCANPVQVYNAVLQVIAEAPTVDAAEVVRCKDCKSCKLCYPEKQIGKEATPGWYCKKHKSYRRPDDFCSYGERREGE